MIDNTLNQRALITTPGLYPGMSMADYQSDPCPAPSLSSGIARTLISRSPLHAWTDHPRLNPNHKSEESTKFDLGSAAHALLLEGEDRMEVIDADDWRTKAAREARDAARAADRYPVLQKHYDDVRRMRDAALVAIARCTDFGYTLDQGKAEQVICWQEDGAWCRIRPDWLSNDRRRQMHYKTTGESAHPDAWLRTMTGMATEIEIAMYAHGNRATGGPADQLSAFLVQENYEPYACSWVGLDDDFMGIGAQKFKAAIAIWKDCVQSNVWPGYTDKIAYLVAPAYVHTQWEERQVSGMTADQATEFYRSMYGEKR